VGDLPPSHYGCSRRTLLHGASGVTTSGVVDRIRIQESFPHGLVICTSGERGCDDIFVPKLTITVLRQLDVVSQASRRTTECSAGTTRC